MRGSFLLLLYSVCVYANNDFLIYSRVVRPSDHGLSASVVVVCVCVCVGRFMCLHIEYGSLHGLHCLVKVSPYTYTILYRFAIKLVVCSREMGS